jgi:glyoxylase-like metal-dependent hydrolase (beta-lactamase superfamily II)
MQWGMSRRWASMAAQIEHPKGLILVDTGWHRDMSPEGVYDKAAQIKSLGSRVLYNVNQGQIPLGEAVDEQLATMGIKPADLDYVLLTHLDCDHANGLRAVKITREDGKYVLLFSDGGYATKSWKEMITSGVSLDKEMQRKSLQWIREQSMDANCIESLATHDTDIKPHVIEL